MFLTTCYNNFIYVYNSNNADERLSRKTKIPTICSKLDLYTAVLQLPQPFAIFLIRLIASLVRRESRQARARCWSPWRRPPRCRRRAPRQPHPPPFASPRCIAEPSSSRPPPSPPSTPKFRRRDPTPACTCTSITWWLLPILRLPPRSGMGCARSSCSTRTPQTSTTAPTAVRLAAGGGATGPL